MNNINNSIKAGCIFFVIYFILFFIFPQKVFILTGIAYLIFLVMMFFSRKRLLNTAFVILDEIKSKKELGEEHALNVSMKPYLNLTFFASSGFFFQLEGLFFSSGLVCLIYLLYLFAKGNIGKKRKKDLENVPDFLSNDINQEDWSELSLELKQRLYGFREITAGFKFYFRTIFNLLLVAAILYNEIYLGIDTWAWVGF